MQVGISSFKELLVLSCLTLGDTGSKGKIFLVAGMLSDLCLIFSPRLVIHTADESGWIQGMECIVSSLFVIMDT